MEEPEIREPRVLYFATESRLHRGPDGRIWSVNPSDWYENLTPWLRTFDRFVLVARVDDALSSAGQRVEGRHVDVAAIPNYKGALQLLRRYRRVRQAVAKACSDNSAHYGGRFPGIIAGMVLRDARRLRAPMLAHVVGDPRAVLRTGVVGLPGRLAAGFVGLTLRAQLGRVDAAIYVTKQQLQSLYPVKTGRPTMSRSDVVVTSESFADKPRVYSPITHQWRLAAVGSQDQMYKGHDLLISSLRMLRADGHDISLDLVGSGRYHGLLRQLAAAEGVSKHVRFHGHVASPQGVRRILDEADLFVMPSRTEGVPRALIEAMARGLPCLGSNVGGIPELLAPEFLFPAEDVTALTAAVKRVIGESQNLSRQSSANIESARRLADEAAPEKLDEFLQQFAALNGSSGRTSD